MSKREKAFFIDTNIFLRALINDDAEKYADVISFLEKVKANHYKAYCSGIVLAEIIWTLTSFYKLSKNDVTRAVDSIINLNGVTFVETQKSAEAVDLYKKYNVKFIDCLIYSGLDSLVKDWFIVSYDLDFDKLGAKRVEPNSF